MTASTLTREQLEAYVSKLETALEYAVGTGCPAEQPAHREAARANTAAWRARLREVIASK